MGPGNVEIGKNNGWMKCLQQMYGSTFAAWRIEWMNGNYDMPLVAQNVNMSTAAGMPPTHYLVSGFEISNSSTQSPGMLLNALKQAGIYNNATIWFWMEQQCSTFWDQTTCTCSKPASFMASWLSTLAGLTSVSKTGILSDATSWNACVGNNGYTQYPLAYIDQDYQQSFNDFTSFGGWTQPTLKYMGESENQAACSVGQTWVGMGLLYEQ